MSSAAPKISTADAAAAGAGLARGLGVGVVETMLVGPALGLPPSERMTVPGLLMDVAARRSGEVALRSKELGVWREHTWDRVVERIRDLALGFHELGVRKGDRVAIMGDPSPQWLLADFAAQCIGAISYGLYPTSAPDEAAFVLEHGGARVLVAEDQEHVDKVLPLVDRLPGLKKIAVMDASNMFGYDHPLLTRLDDIVAKGASITDGAERFAALWRAVSSDDPATIVYTSGTSANPKGALYSHRALVTQGHQFFEFSELSHARGVRSVVHLPMNHLYERMNTPMGMLVKGIVPHFGDEVERFTQSLYEVAPQHHASVPRYWSKLASRVIVGVESSSSVKRIAYASAMRIGRAYRQRRWAGRSAPMLGLAYGLAKIAVFDRMLKKIGLSRVEIALSAGAPLPADVQALWQIWGVNLKNVLGQTEGGILAAQFDSFPKPGGVGKPYPLAEIELGADGEIIARSPGSFAGYWQDAAATAEALRPDGIRTGDVGEIVDGELVLIDRKKDIIITAGGKNISPSRIETMLKASAYVSEASVIGDGRKYLTALIEIDVGTVSEWARSNNVLYTSYAALAAHPDVNRLLAGEIARANAQLGRVEQLKTFRIIDRELDPEMEGEAITATRKIKRGQLEKHFGHLINAMYAEDESERIARQLN